MFHTLNLQETGRSEIKHVCGLQISAEMFSGLISPPSELEQPSKFFQI